MLVYVWEMGMGSVHWVLLPPGGNPEVSAPSCHLPSSNLGCGPISGHVAKGPIRMWVPLKLRGADLGSLVAQLGLGSGR